MQPARVRRALDEGFTLMELMVVLGLVAVLTLIALPIYVSSQALTTKRTCFANQNTLERATELYLAVNLENDRTDLEGVVDSDHPIIVNQIIGKPPRCPSGADPADPDSPTVAEGAYTFNDRAGVEPCTLGPLGPHGHFSQ
jgi:prepilin-type N-terminal cleavage/methylation domain-containing protein